MKLNSQISVGQVCIDMQIHGYAHICVSVYLLLSLSCSGCYRRIIINCGGRTDQFWEEYHNNCIAVFNF